MSSRMPFPTGKKSLCCRDWDRMPVSSMACAQNHLPRPTSTLYLMDFLNADGAYAVAYAGGRTLAVHGEQLSLMY